MVKVNVLFIDNDKFSEKEMWTLFLHMLAPNPYINIDINFVTFQWYSWH